MGSEFPTELNRDIFDYVEVQQHTAKEARDHFGVSLQAIYWHLGQFRQRCPLPPDYIERLRNACKQLAEKSLMVINKQLDEQMDKTEGTDATIAIKTARGNTVLVDQSNVQLTGTLESPSDPNKLIDDLLDERLAERERKKAEAQQSTPGDQEPESKDI